MDFKKYCSVAKEHAIEFKEGQEWDVDQWNDSYIDYHNTVANYSKDFIAKCTPEELVIEWVRDYYQGTTFDTHSYRVFKKIDDWYCAETTKPEFNLEVLVFIPAEDDHVTSGMWDIDKKWVLLDEYLVVPRETPEIIDGHKTPDSIVTYWTYSPDTSNLK